MKRRNLPEVRHCQSGEVRLLNAGPDAVPVGWWWCGNCQGLVSDARSWHQCPSVTERLAS